MTCNSNNIGLFYGGVLALAAVHFRIVYYSDGVQYCFCSVPLPMYFYVVYYFGTQNVN